MTTMTLPLSFWEKRQNALHSLYWACSISQCIVKTNQLWLMILYSSFQEEVRHLHESATMTTHGVSFQATSLPPSGSNSMMQRCSTYLHAMESRLQGLTLGKGKICSFRLVSSALSFFSLAGMTALDLYSFPVAVVSNYHS